MEELRCMECAERCVAAVTCRSCTVKLKSEIDRLNTENKALKEKPKQSAALLTQIANHQQEIDRLNKRIEELETLQCNVKQCGCRQKRKELK